MDATIVITKTLNSQSTNYVLKLEADELLFSVLAIILFIERAKNKNKSVIFIYGHKILLSHLCRTLNTTFL